MKVLGLSSLGHIAIVVACSGTLFPVSELSSIPGLLVKLLQKHVRERGLHMGQLCAKKRKQGLGCRV